MQGLVTKILKNYKNSGIALLVKLISMESVARESVEDIILRNEMLGVSSSRGISRLRPYLPPDFCRQAAKELLYHREKILIATGFYIEAANASETDGPPGAIMLADALWKLGIAPLIVTDEHAAEAIRQSCNHHVYTFPITDGEKESERYVSELLGLRPSAAVAIERCGRGADGKYSNMRGVDISAQTARIDKIFLGGYLPTKGVGDGGNEIGMGNVADEVIEHRVHSSPRRPFLADRESHCHQAG